MANLEKRLQQLLKNNPKLTPMMTQYVSIKQNHWDELLFYRMGDFYELFFDDAIKASELLNITLTHRGHVEETPIPMAGVPYHAASNYIQRLNNLGEKVVICEQVSAPGQGTIVERKVVQITSAALPYDLDQVQEKHRHFICSAFHNNDQFHISFLDFTTGEFFGQSNLHFDQFIELILFYSPREFLAPLGLWDSYPIVNQMLKQEKIPITLISNDYFCSQIKSPYLIKVLPQVKIDQYLSSQNNLLKTISAISYYIHTTQPAEKIVHIRPYRLESRDGQMQATLSTLQGLEILPKSQDKQSYQQSILGLFDCCKTSIGSRQLRRIFETPLRDTALLECRYDWINFLIDNPNYQDNIIQELSGIKDIDRILAKASTKKIHAQDLYKIQQSISHIEKILPILNKFPHASSLSIDTKIMQDLKNLADIISHRINDELGASLENGNLIKKGFHRQRDKLSNLKDNSDEQLKILEEKYRTKLQISNLKIKHNNIHGYFIEVSNSHLSKIPKSFQRRQTLVNSERFTTTELLEFEKNVYAAKEKLELLEKHLFQEVIDELLKHISDLSFLSDKIALIDSLCALAYKAVELQLVRPQIISNKKERIFKVKKAFHPLVKEFSQKLFIEHDLSLDKNQYFGLITGPNMAGKTTVMREMAIIQFLAQIGSFVPAASANLSLCDFLFSRLGAQDNIIQGQSTFMVEMTQMSQILQHATAESFIVVDEIGRGTSTYDGVSLAWAIVEHLTQRTKSFTLFSTHYHELVPVVDKLPMAKNLTVETKIENNKVEFLYNLIEQGVTQSYGIYVAKLAGIPSTILERANDILSGLEEKPQEKKSTKKIAKGEQLKLFMIESPISTEDKKQELFKTKLQKELANLNPLQMSPMQALKKLIYFQEKFNKFH